MTVISELVLIIIGCSIPKKNTMWNFQNLDRKTGLLSITPSGLCAIGTDLLQQFVSPFNL